jgi:hypothetical protein
METKNLADLYGLAPLDWTAVRSRLEGDVTQAPGTGGPDRHTFWLTTLDPDGAPHVAGIGGFWLDGAIWFQTGERTRKGRNLARDPRCAVSVALHDYDVVVEGEAIRVRDRTAIADFVARAVAGGWPAEVDPSGEAVTAAFSAPSAGPAPWAVYRVTARQATALCTVEPGGATRWRF